MFTHDPLSLADECWKCGLSKSQSLRLFRCKNCKVAKYCGKACQVSDWKEKHNLVCEQLRARRSAKKRLKKSQKDAEKENENENEKSTTQEEQEVYRPPFSVEDVMKQVFQGEPWSDNFISGKPFTVVFSSEPGVPHTIVQDEGGDTADLHKEVERQQGADEEVAKEVAKEVASAKGHDVKVDKPATAQEVHEEEVRLDKCRLENDRLKLLLFFSSNFSCRRRTPTRRTRTKTRRAPNQPWE